jgi:hypothetical protein
MTEKLNEQTDKMREMAQTSLEKARAAVSKYMEESERLRAKADSGIQASYSSAKEMNQKSVAFAEANVLAGFDFAQQMLGAKDAKDIGAIYQAFMKDQMGKMTAQFQEFGGSWAKAAGADLKK